MGSRRRRIPAPIYPPTVFNIYKPKGPTSGSVVDHFKHHLPKGFGKIGHFGTLDPFAEGVLLIGVAGAQRLNHLVHEYLPKTYLACGLIGTQTDTADSMGQVIHRNEASELEDSLYSKLSADDLQKRWRERFLGTYRQRPPMYSASKHEGRPLYAYAREGIVVDKEAVAREILKLEVVEKHSESVVFRVQVSSGTYVRTLFEDLMGELGLLGHLTELKREAIGHLHWENALREEQWPVRTGTEQSEYFARHGLPVDQVLNFPKIVFDAHRSTLFGQGVALRNDQALVDSSLPGPHWVYGESGELLGLAQSREAQWRLLMNFCGPDQSGSR